MSDETDKQIRERLERIFPSPEVASKVVDIVVKGNRPQGWGRNSNAPYYKPMYAEQIQSQIDRMIETGNDIVYRYSVWCNEETQMTPNTLYTRINQSIRYLCEKMDSPTGKYGTWYDTVRITREKTVGVVIRFIPGFKNGPQDFKGDEIVPKANMPTWKRRLEEWLEGDEVKPFCAEGLALSVEEIEVLKNQFAQLTNIMASITSSYIKVIKMN